MQSPITVTTVAAALCLITASGCGSSGFDDLMPAGWAAGRDEFLLRGESIALSSSGIVSYGQPEEGQDGRTNASTAASALPIPSDADAELYVLIALKRNLAIKSAQRRYLKLLERIPQARSLTDPMLEVAFIGEMAETAAGQVEAMTRISQKFPYPGKLATRGEVAAHEAAAAGREVEATRISIIADTRRAFWTLYFAVRAIDVTGRSRELVKQFRASAEAKYKAGIVGQPDVLRASVELGILDNDLIGFHQRRDTAVAMLNSLLDRHPGAPLPDPMPIALQDFTLELEALITQAQRVNPILNAIHERIERDRQRMKLARLDRYPDVTVGLTYNAVDDQGLSSVANGDDQWWLSFGLNLPIWQVRLDAAEREAFEAVMQNLARLDDERNRVAFRVSDALANVQAQRHHALLLRDVILADARQAVDASAGAYRVERTDFLTLIDNWRKMLDLELMYHESIVQLERSLADLQQAVGADLRRNEHPRNDDADANEDAATGRDPEVRQGAQLDNRQNATEVPRP